MWRGQNEDYDFWGRERRPLHAQEHPGLWQRVKGAFTGRGPKNSVRSDDRIREDVCEHLSYHPYIDASDIEQPPAREAGGRAASLTAEA